MKSIQQRFVVIASLVGGLLGCNSGPAAESAHAAASTTPTTAPATYLEADRLKESLAYLASDELEGRGLTTEGLNKAADFIAADFKQSGMKPLPGLDGYFQPFTATISTSLDESSSLSIDGRKLELRETFTPVGISAEGEFKAPLAFVGYGISSDDHKYDDYAGIDVTGRAVVAMRYEPHDSEGESRFDKSGWSDAASLTTKAKTAAEHGAAALILVNPPEHHGSDRLMSFARGGGDRAKIPVVMITAQEADALLSRADRGELASIQSSIDASGKPESFLINGVVAGGAVHVERVEKTLKNVVGCLPGKGPRAGEFIGIGAHYDHLGRGERGSISRDNEIHNGADDNGSGTVALMELARKLAKMPRERSIVFIAFTGEERGLLGSAYFVKNPPVKLDQIAAMVNLDMVGRIKDGKVFVGGTGTADPLEAIVQKADARSPLKVEVAGAMVGGKGGIGPSDHESFALKKVPVVFFYSGMHVDYHRPTDDVEKINYLGLAEVVDMVSDVVLQLDRMPPAQYVDKFDRAFMASGSGGGGSNVRLGIMPDYSEGTDSGVLVSGTMPDSPALRAGIKEGDVIIGIDDSKIGSLGDYMSAMGKHKPGETIRVKVLRGTEELILDATLTGPRG
jgi:hypothetical protein